MIKNEHSVLTGFDPVQTNGAEASWINPDLVAEPAEVRGKRILVVDDQEPVRECLRMVLEMDGYQVTEASDGAEALRSFTSDQFDLVITDLEMPVMRGNELAAGIKSLAPSVPILMITASAGARRETGNPVDALLSKPFMVNELRFELRKLFSAQPVPALECLS